MSLNELPYNSLNSPNASPSSCAHSIPVDLDIIATLTSRSSKRSTNRSHSITVSMDKPMLLYHMTELMSSITNAMCSNDETKVKDTVSIKMCMESAKRHIATLSNVMKVLVAPSPYENLEKMIIVPHDTCEPGSLGEAAASLDANKIRLLLSTSSLAPKDVHSYASLIIAEQQQHKRKTQQTQTNKFALNGAYNPSINDSIKFVEENKVVSSIFDTNLKYEKYFHALRAFTHESATNGKTSSQLLSAIGKYALRAEVYRMAYSNGESYSRAKQRVHFYLDDDKFYDQALKLKINEQIIMGPNNCDKDKEIVLQTVHAIFGVLFFLQGSKGLHLLNDLIQWRDPRNTLW